MRNGQSLEVEITALGRRGDGLARSGDTPIFVPGALPGEVHLVRLTERRGDGFAAQSRRCLTPSPDRVAPRCGHFGECGGCSLQHLPEEQYRRLQRAAIVDALGHQEIAADGLMAETITAPPSSRRRCRLAVRRTTKGLLLGFRAGQSHRIINLEDCAVLVPAILEILPPLRRLLLPMLQIGESCHVVILAAVNGLDLWIDHKAGLDLMARETLAAFANDHALARLCWGHDHEVVAQLRAPMLGVGVARLSPPPGAFVQAVGDSEAAMTALVCENLADCKTVVDLYAGCGGFTLALAARAGVHAIDLAADHLAALTIAAATASQAQADGQSGLKTITWEVRDLNRQPLSTLELKRFDGAVFDPPRAGAAMQARELASSSLRRVTAVSCNPQSFAKDARLLIDGGFELRRLSPIDQFLWSPHIELVADFVR